MDLIQKLDLSAIDFSNDNSLALGGIKVKTGAGSSVKAAIDAAIAAIPADVYLDSLASYTPATNILTLKLTDNSTVDVDMTGLLADAIATVTSGKVAVYGNDETTLLGYLLSPTGV